MKGVDPMKKLLGIAASAAFLIGSAAFAQQTSKPADQTNPPAQQSAMPAPQPTSQYQANPSSAGEGVVGTVTAYQPNQKIEVRTADNQIKTFDLNQTGTKAEVDPSIAVGKKVQVIEVTDKSGKKTIQVIPYGSTRMPH
jgi:opacity protein-like surface antigen